MIHYSVLIPQRDVPGQVFRLLDELCGVLSELGKPYEVICIDDASQAANHRALAALLSKYPCLRLLRLDQAAGTSAALEAGLAAARGEVVVAVDANGGYLAADIHRLVRRLARADAVFGCRRAGPAARTWRRVMQLPRRLLLGIDVRDPHCLFWAARHEAVAGLKLYGTTHRSLPAMIARRGYRVGELHVAGRSLRPVRLVGWLGGLLAGWLPRRRTLRYTVNEVFGRPDSSVQPKLTRIDPPQPLDRHNPGLPEAPRSDRRHRTSE